LTGVWNFFCLQNKRKKLVKPVFNLILQDSYRLADSIAEISIDLLLQNCYFPLVHLFVAALQFFSATISFLMVASDLLKVPWIPL